MKTSMIALATAAGSAYAVDATAYSQCGGINWTGATSCVDGWHCQSQNPYYYQCVTGSATGSATGSSTVATATGTGSGFTSSAANATTAVRVASSSPVSTSTVASTSSYVAPSSSSVAASSSKAPTSSYVASTSSHVASSSSVATSTTPSSSVKSTSTVSSSAAASTSTGKVKYAGINISGFDFGCSTDGTCTVSGVEDPGTTGSDQMSHFVTDDGLNAFRLPVGWQYLVNAELGGTLDSTNFAAYDSLVSSCLDVAELCIVSIHNYARWDGNVIGQSSGSVTNAQFSSLWSQLATKYASKPKVAFGLMNEPHDLSSLSDWATTVQEAVTAIRKAGATSNTILIPGNDWTHAATLVSDGSAAALANVTNLDGTTTNIVYDVHQYLDSDGSGTSTSCSTNHVSDFQSLATWLRSNGRQAFLSETGGGASDSTCITNVCEELQALMDNSDVFLGWTGWAAGEFATSYALSETPSGSKGSYTDQELVTKCIAGIFNSA